MPTSAAGSEGRRLAGIAAPPRLTRRCPRGFTLIELLVVVAIVAIASAGVVFAVRDSAATQLEREAQRLAALLEAGRAQSRASGLAVVWRPTADGFRFEGAPTLPGRWLGEGVRAMSDTPLVLGPEPIIAPQSISLASSAAPGRTVRIASDGLRPFQLAAEGGGP